MPDRVLGIADRECTIFEVSDRRVRFGCKGTLVRHSDSFAFSYSGIEVPAMRTEASALSHFGTWENLALEWQGPAVTDEALLSVQLLDRMGRIIALSTDKKSLPACHSVLEMETLYFKCDDPPDFSNGDVFEIRHESSIVLRQGFPRLSPSTVWFFVKWDLVRHWKFKTIQVCIHVTILLDSPLCKILLRDTRGNLVATSAGESAISSTQSNSSADGRCYLFVSRGKIHVGCENVQFLDKLSVVVDDGSGGNNTTMISCKVSDIYSSTWGRFSLKWTRRQPLPPPSLLTVFCLFPGLLLFDGSNAGPNTWHWWSNQSDLRHRHHPLSVFVCSFFWQRAGSISILQVRFGSIFFCWRLFPNSIWRRAGFERAGRPGV